jgi:hypothetical protein
MYLLSNFHCYAFQPYWKLKHKNRACRNHGFAVQAVNSLVKAVDALAAQLCAQGRGATACSSTLQATARTGRTSIQRFQTVSNGSFRLV